MNLRPLGPQPSALPDCATPRGVFILTDWRTRCRWERLFASICWAGETLRALQNGETAGRVCLASAGAGAARYVLTTMPRRVQAGALPGQQAALHRRRRAAEESPSPGEDDLSDRLLPRPSLRRLRRGRSSGAGVRPSARQKIRDLSGHTGAALAGRARRDCKVRRGLCKLSSTPHR